MDDWMYMTEQLIVPHLKRGFVVVKDRGPDTVLACQLPGVIGEYGEEFGEKTYARLKSALELAPAKPDVTFYFQVPLLDRIARIEARRRDFAEDRANAVSEEDIRMFNSREEIYLRLARENPHRIVTVKNYERSVEATAEETFEIVKSLYSKP